MEYLIRIAICDDMEEFIEKQTKLLNRYANEKLVRFHISKFMDGLGLTDAVKNNKYDVIFLDINMPGINGFEIANIIRQYDNDVFIVFNTSFYTTENAMKGYNYNAIDFIQKPLSYVNLRNIMDKIYNKRKLKCEKNIVIRNNKGIFRIAIEDITYIETSHKNVLIHTINTDFISYAKLSTFEVVLKECFVRCHKSYLVNMDYIFYIKNNDAILTNKVKIPISKYKKSWFMKTLAAYYGGK